MVTTMVGGRGLARAAMRPASGRRGSARSGAIARYPWWPGVLPGAGGWAVAVQHLGFVKYFGQV